MNDFLLCKPLIFSSTVSNKKDYLLSVCRLVPLPFSSMVSKNTDCRLGMLGGSLSLMASSTFKRLVFVIIKDLLVLDVTDLLGVMVGVTDLLRGGSSILVADLRSGSLGTGETDF